MKSTRSLLPALAALGILCLSAFTAQAEWTYVSGNKTTSIKLTDGNWTVEFSKNNAGDAGWKIANLNNWAKDASNPDYCLDLSNIVVDDVEYKVVEFVGGMIIKKWPITDFIAPDMVKLGQESISQYGQSVASLTNVVLSPDVQSIGVNCFYGMTGLKKFSPRVAPALTTLGNSAFINCTSLEGEFSFPALKAVGNAAFKSTKITSVSLPVATEIGNEAFRDCSALTSVSATSSLQTIMKNAFYGDNALEFFTPAALSSVVTFGEYAFYNCAKLTGALNLAEATSIGQYAFRQTGFTSLSAPKSETIGVGAFYAMTDLAEVSHAPSENATSVGTHIFYGCTALTGPYTWNVPNVTALPAHAFDGCSALKDLTIKSLVSSVGEQALLRIAPGCSITWFGDAPTWGFNAMTLASAGAYPVIHLADNPVPESWTTAVEAKAGSVAHEKSTAPQNGSYPGDEHTLGLVQGGYASTLAWVAYNDYNLIITGETADGTTVELGDVSPAFGAHYGLSTTEPTLLTASSAAIPVSAERSVVIKGWDLYEIAADGTETKVASGENNSYALSYAAGKQYRFVWRVSQAFTVSAAAATGGGSVAMFVGGEPVEPGAAFAEGTEVTFAATADSATGASFWYWSGDLPGGRSAEPSVTVTVGGPVSVRAVFRHPWTYDSEAKVLTDTINWTLKVTPRGSNLSISGYTAGGEDLDFTSLEADTECKVTGVDANFYFQRKCGITAFVAPDITSLAASALAADADHPGQTLHRVVLSDQLTTINNSALAYLSALETFLPTSCVTLTTIGSSAFRECHSLVGDFDYPGLTRIETYTFTTARSITSFTATNVTWIGEGCFTDSTSLRSVRLSDDLETIMPSGIYGLKGCSNLETFHPTKCSKLRTLGGTYFFAFCPKLKGDWEFPLLSSIGANTFQESTSITSVRFGSIATVGTKAFYACSGLTNVTFDCATPTVSGDSFTQLAPGAEVHFTGNPPTTGFSAKSGGDLLRFVIPHGREAPAWIGAVAPNAETFADYRKTRSDYPGRRAFGLVNAGSLAWAIDPIAPGLSVIIR